MRFKKAYLFQQKRVQKNLGYNTESFLWTHMWKEKKSTKTNRIMNILYNNRDLFGEIARALRSCAMAILVKWLYRFLQKDFPDHGKGVSFCNQSLR